MREHGSLLNHAVALDQAGAFNDGIGPDDATLADLRVSADEDGRNQLCGRMNLYIAAQAEVRRAFAPGQQKVR